MRECEYLAHSIFTTWYFGLDPQTTTTIASTIIIIIFIVVLTSSSLHSLYLLRIFYRSPHSPTHTHTQFMMKKCKFNFLHCVIIRISLSELLFRWHCILCVQRSPFFCCWCFPLCLHIYFIAFVCYCCTYIVQRSISLGYILLICVFILLQLVPALENVK